MGLGILEDKVLSHVPGTEILDDHTSTAAIEDVHQNVKRSQDGIILVPQPSDDPNDPLNWPLWRRDMITALLSLTAVFGSTLTPLLAANSITFLSWFPHVTTTDIAMLTGWHMLGIGVGGYCFVASARIWGKRHLYILGMFIMVIASIWSGVSGKNYNSFVAGRFFQGVGLAPFEALLNASVGELYFVHESGLRMALSNMSLFGASFLTPVIVGNMTATIGWEWCFFVVAICIGATFPLVILLCPETAYVRKNTVTSSETPESVTPPKYDSKDSTSLSVDKFDSSAAISTELSDFSEPQPHHQTAQPALISRQSLRLFTGRKTDENFFKVLIRPLPLFLHPSVLWSCLIQGSIIGWTTLLGVMLALLMIQLGFNEVKTGNMYTGAFIGAVVGFAACGLLTDWTARVMTKWNKGVYEPEFRLVLIVPLLVFGAGGLYGFGITSADTSYGWLLPDVFFAWLCGGLVFGTVAPALYIVDAHRDLAVEAFTCMLLFKNLISWALCWRGFEWLAEAGPRDLFVIIASVEVGICMLTVPLYVFGKKNRSFMSRHDYLATLGLR